MTRWETLTKEQKRVIVERSAAYKRANPGKYDATQKAWKAANRERVNAIHERWKAKNPEVYKHCQENRIRTRNITSERIRSQNRINQKRGGKLSEDLPLKLLKLQKGKCAYCRKPLEGDYHLDHIQPLSKGGAHADWNIQLLHSKCNLQKHDKDPVQFMQEKGFLL